MCDISQSLAGTGSHCLCEGVHFDRISRS